MPSVLIPIPEMDFDPTEVAVSWKVLTALGHQVIFATPNGRRGSADDMMLTGRGLDPWGRVPVLRRFPLIGLLMRAKADGRRAYDELQHAPVFRAPLKWEDVQEHDADGLLLPGGHRGRGMRAFLESLVVQQLVLGFFAAGKPVAAICHGVLPVARSVDPATGKSVLHGRRTTALTWKFEQKAWMVGRRTRFWDPNYYRTYLEQPGQPNGYMSVQQEVTRALASREDFLDVPEDAPHHWLKTNGLSRDTLDDGRPAWVVRDGNYISARWPGDVHTFAKTFSQVLAEGLPLDARGRDGVA